MDKRSFVAATLVVALASGCATTGALEDGSPSVRERLAGGGRGMLIGALGGIGGAILLTGGEPEAALYVSVVTVPTLAAYGLIGGLNDPAKWRGTPQPAAAHASGEVSPEGQHFVRAVAYEARDRHARRKK